MGARQTLSSCVDARHSSQPAFAKLLTGLVQTSAVLDGHQHRERSMITLDEKVLAGGGGVEDRAQRAPKV